MQIRSGIELANLTDAGCVRQENEDYYGYWEPDEDELLARKGRLAIVADGMGGIEGGQVASRLAVEAVREAYRDSAAEDVEAALLEGFRAAHSRIRQFARAHPELAGMGTTCTALVVIGGQLYFAHVGDSRLYLIRNTAILRLTKDHSYVGRLVEEQVISAREADTHPQRHVLTAAVGARDTVAADVAEAPVPLAAGDVLLLCTDGLWTLVRDEELLSAVVDHDPATACQDLLRLAKARGGPDNITLQILRIGVLSERGPTVDVLARNARNGEGS